MNASGPAFRDDDPPTGSPFGFRTDITPMVRLVTATGPDAAEFYC